MIRNTLVRSALLLFSLTLVGCHLYFEEGGNSYEDELAGCRGRACEPSASPWPDAGPYDDSPVLEDAGAGSGPSCYSDLGCGPGCFCNDAGLCEEIGSDPLPDATPFACSDLDSDEAACNANPACDLVYSGVHCTAADGSVCGAQSVDCSCESFVFDYCRDA